MKFKGRLTYRNFLDYFGNKLEKKEKHVFEKKIMQDSFESEAFDGISKLSTAEFEKDMTDLNSLIHARTKEKKRRIPVWFPYAASVIILLGLSSVLYYLNQYSAQDEMIGAQMEELTPKIEKPIAEPELIEEDSESADLMEMIDEDLEMEISDADEIVVEELMVVKEDDEVEIIPAVKSKQVELVAPVQQVVVAREVYKKEAEVSAESMQRALEGQVAGVQGQKSNRKKSATSNLKQNNKLISGKVVDENEMPLPGACVLIKGTTKGVVTDIDGQFKFDTSNIREDYKLVASFIGFESKEISITKDSTLLVILEQDHASIDEVVVVGFGKQKKESVSGAVTLINHEDDNSTWEKAKPNQFASISKFEDYLIKELKNMNFEHLQGTHKVKFTFVVEPYGALSDIKFKGKSDSILEKEIERLLLNSGDWYPAESGGKAVASKVRITLKLNFD